MSGSYDQSGIRENEISVRFDYEDSLFQPINFTHKFYKKY